MKDPAIVENDNGFTRDFWFLIFKTGSGSVRILNVAIGLAKVLKLLISGLSVAQVLEAFESERDRAAVTASVRRLMLTGVPFAQQQSTDDFWRE